MNDITHGPFTTELRKGLPPLPKYMLSLPVSDKGYPVPFFVKWIDDKPDFRVVDPDKYRTCVYHHRCWICGEPYGANVTFVAGPVSAMNATSGEPPSHHSCAAFAVRACPFLLLPNAQRRDANLPPGEFSEGLLEDNPGVCMLWTTGDYRLFKSSERGDWLIRMGSPERIEWFAQGRDATREEVVRALDAGIKKLLELCDTAQDRIVVRAQRDAFERHLPPE